jgi:arginine utilization protein RocB
MELRWRDEVEELTARLVKINSVSPSVNGENACAAEIRRALSERGVASGTWPMRTDARKIVWAMVEGRGSPPGAEPIPTVILLGHLDTAGVQDYGSDLDPFNPERLRQELLEQYRRNPGTDDERLLDAASGEWMFGRGSFDMKSGVAAQVAVMGALERAKDLLLGNVLMVTTPDEEVESAGLMDGLPSLIGLRNARRLEFLGVINSDYSAPRDPEDDNRYIYRGTIGKLLCCFYVRGCEMHVGEAFRGLDANLIAANLVRETNLNVDLCDALDGEITVPPVTQKVRDFKARYDAQTPISAVVYCSCLVHGWTAEDVLPRMIRLADRALDQASDRRAGAWKAYASRQGSTKTLSRLGGVVYTYAQLHEAVAGRMGSFALQEELEERAFGTVEKTREILEALSPAARDFLIDRAQLVDPDSRERSLVIVRTLVDIAIRENVLEDGRPAVVIYFAPPFFPPVRGDPNSRLNRAIVAELRSQDYGRIQVKGFYPYVSEISFMRVDKAVEEALPVLKANFPLWRDPNTDEDEVVREETFGVPFDLIRELNCDVANIGPWGKEAHGRGERVHMPYSFETVPQLIHNVILRLLGTEGERIPLPRSPNAEERR